MAQSIGSPLFWTGFLLVVFFLLLIDLGIFHRKAHAVGFKEALFWSATWVALSISFGIGVYLKFGAQKGLEFFAGYLIEYALSVDNIFVFILIFSYFSVPKRLHHRVLFWGILGALCLRLVFILVGAALIEAFHWVLYLFGAFLVLTGIKILKQGETNLDPKRNPVVRAFQRITPMVSDYQGGGFFVRHNGKLSATPLALVLITVETTDVVFAVDSIPAIFGVSHDPFIVFTSNICAILGLRTMYFMLAAVVDRFAYLNVGLGIVLAFIGVKMLIAGVYKIPITTSLLVVASVLLGSVLLSLARPPKQLKPPGETSIRQSPLITSAPDE